MNDLPAVSRTGALEGAISAGAICLVLLLSTCEIAPMSWDEGNAIVRAEGIARWFGRLGADRPEGDTGPFSQATIADDWRYVTQIEGHPAFYGLVIAAGHWLAEGMLMPLGSYRFGPMLLFSLAVGAFYYRLARDHGPVAASAGVAALLTMPRLFAHAHFASIDGPLTSCWILAWATFARGMRGRWFWGLPWGACLGLTMSCKFTGWLAVFPFALWCAAHANRRGLRNAVIGLAAAAATLWLVNPPLWHRPVSGLAQFFELNLNRGEQGLDVPTWFFGERYDLHRPLPWYNSLFWTAGTVPTGTLLLALVGLAAAVRGGRGAAGAGLLLAANWAVLPVVRAMPLAPPHDAERLMLPAFAFLAGLAGLGAASAWSWARARGGVRACRLTAAGLVALFVGSASSVAWYAPQWLSYYNVLVGGLRGATALGMEPTYYWDALDGEAFEWLHAHTAERETVAFAAASDENLMLQQKWGVFQRNLAYGKPDARQWYVLQRRPSFYSDFDRRLIETGRPAFVKTIRPPHWGWGPWKLDVPVLEIYPVGNEAGPAP